MEIQPNSGLGENVFKYLHVDRLTGVHIYQGDKGGWFFDLTFKDLPDGVPNIIGTPNMYPHETRKEAEEAAVAMLANLVANAHKPPESSDDAVAVFPFDDVEFKIPAKLLAALREIPGGPPDVDSVLRRLEEVRETCAGGRHLTAEVMEELTKDQQEQIYIVAAMAVLRGIVRFPAYEEAPPVSRRH